jgi:hypothetical protein
MKFDAVCSVCGKTYPAHVHKKDGVYHCSRLCAKRTRQAKERARVLQEEHKGVLRLDFAVLRGVGTLVVVNDPLDKGGWKPGQQFRRDEWLRMYHLMTFTHGTILRDAKGRLYRADGSAA